MAWVALSCPQCSAPLPRVAIWRAVKCPSCGSLITRTESVVARDTFRQALVRARQGSVFSGRSVQCGGQGYSLVQLLGRGEISEVYLAQRIGALPLLVTLKLSSAPGAAAHYQREVKVLRELQAFQGGAADAGLSQRLPQVVALGVVEDNPVQHALVLRHPSGCWGSLAALNERFPQGVDPRHAIWIWRRMLEVLRYVHSRSWSHGDIRPEHALVHPADHGVRLIGWASARKDASANDQATDLMRSARVVLVLLNGASATPGVANHVPAELSQLVTQASQDEKFCRQYGAAGLDELVRAAAKAAYGPPAFVPLIL